MASQPIKIKTGVVQRLIKEQKAYAKEYEHQLSRIARVERETPDDDWNIRKQKQVLEETVRMIPDVEQRLCKAVEELTDLVQAHEHDLAGTEELKRAKDCLTLAASSAEQPQDVAAEGS